MLIIQENGAFCINVKQKCFKFKRKAHGITQTEKKWNEHEIHWHARYHAQFLCSIYLLNGNIRRQITISNRTYEIDTERRRSSHSENLQTEQTTEEHWFERWLELRRELGLHVCWKMIGYFLAYKAKWFTLFCANFFFDELCWKQNNVHSIEIVDFFFFIFM